MSCKMDLSRMGEWIKIDLNYVGLIIFVEFQQCVINKRLIYWK